MGNLLNLRRERKRREKALEEQQAQSNRLRFGEPKPIRELNAAKSSAAIQKLDQHKLTSEIKE
jgi:hypothetical protein